MEQITLSVIMQYSTQDHAQHGFMEEDCPGDTAHGLDESTLGCIENCLSRWLSPKSCSEWRHIQVAAGYSWCSLRLSIFIDDLD
ncbi:hypothetical protein TURU_126958 [Turdus rufiventris]|nr:hypothetical protein TURU_126958 [Turdus rufiventris]